MQPAGQDPKATNSLLIIDTVCTKRSLVKMAASRSIRRRTSQIRNEVRVNRFPSTSRIQREIG